MSSTTQEFNCIFCKETFENKEDLQIHFRKHGDPNFNQNKKPKSRPQSETQTASSDKKSEEVEMVRCDVCPEMFPTISKAITHKHKVHPDHDAKYFCPWCGKLFTMKHLYNKHLQSNHVNLERMNDNFHCDVCDVDFYVPSAMLYHNKFFHRQDTDLPSIGKSKKVKMCQQEVVQIYYCAFCGDEYENKVNLHKHMSDDHSDENQSPEDVLRCPLCEAIFYHLDAYEVHLTFHTTEDLYRETNEMFEQITEFSLETVPPIMEKVENVEPQEDVESAMNAVGIDKFLEMAMGDSLDNDGTKHKSKKHKKHKKKKKEAITLDEFLNMNKDVFGEGLDFQGVEEVPTQVLAKRLKQKKVMKPPSSLRVAQSSEIEKLKKQGIVVKMKTSNKSPNMQNIRVANKIVSRPIQNVNKSSTNVHPDEVISKLMNQPNSQIKIVKKAAQDDKASDQPEEQMTSILENRDFAKRSSSPENIEVECDVNPISGYTSSENEAKEENSEKVSKNDLENDQQVTADKSNNGKPDLIHKQKETSAICSGDLNNTENENNTEENNDKDINEEINNEDMTEEINDEDIAEEINDEKYTEKILQDELSQKDESENKSITALKNNLGITIKSVTKAPKPLVENTTESQDDNVKTICKEGKDDEDLIDEPETTSNHSINALKHLSHLITIKSVAPKQSPTPSHTETGLKESKVSSNQDEEKCSDQEEEMENANHKEIPKLQTQAINEKSLNSLNSLKNLSKNITIKPVAISPKNVIEKTSEDEEDNMNTMEGNRSAEHTVSSPQGSNKLSTSVKTAESNNSPLYKGQNAIKITKSIGIKDVPNNQDKQSNINLLKHLTNVTAKPVNTVRSHVQSIPNNRSSMSTQNITKKSITQNIVKKPVIDEEIEIFNIDDSDDEPDDKVEQPVIKTSSPKPTTSDNKSSKPLDTLKSISKHITVKPVNQQTTFSNKNIVKESNQSNPEPLVHNKNQGSFSDFSDEDDDQNTLVPTNYNSVQHKLNLQNDSLKTTLKSLSKHITVKPGNASPNISIKSSKDNFKDDLELDEAGDSDDSHSGKVKITEVTEDGGLSEDEMADQSNQQNGEYDDNITVKSPEGSNSEHDNFGDEDDDEITDIESQIQVSTLNNPNIAKLKKANQNLSIKSLADKKELVSKAVETNIKKIPNINSAVTIKPLKQTRNETTTSEGTFTNKKSMMNTAQVKRSIINQNQAMASTSQQNTVNKEVTVKTFQTKTVIQEITTTVTKTIKTVNQTVKQEIQSTSQNNVVKFQKVQGIKSSNQQVKNFQGVTVRHANPVAGTKIRGGAPPVAGGIIRPSNQLVPYNPVPVRPARNTARMSVPRMPAVKRNIAPGAVIQTRPTLGRPLKISPNAVNTTKRSTDESIGHFSCFKKPKESLIPGTEIPSFDSDQGDSTVQFSSTQMSKSNFTSATKTIRGNTVVKQMKSEMSTSSQQLEKLSGMSGLKIMKTSQSKQAMKVEEKCEMSPSKRNALEAIEKLQKQGLLVKKPRIEEVNNESDHSDDGDDYITEEPDE